jgi:hypothetical protein
VLRLGLVLLAAAALLLAACGGGGGGGKPLTRSDLIKRGDAVCTKYRAKNKALQKNAPAKSPTDPSASDEDVRKSSPILASLADNVRGARGEFAQLRPPKDIAGDWRNTLEDLDLLAKKLDDAADAAKSVDRQRVVNDYAEALRLNSRVSNFESGYGFQVCGKSG